MVVTANRRCNSTSMFIVQLGPVRAAERQHSQTLIPISAKSSFRRLLLLDCRSRQSLRRIEVRLDCLLEVVPFHAVDRPHLPGRVDQERPR